MWPSRVPHRPVQGAEVSWVRMVRLGLVEASRFQRRGLVPHFRRAVLAQLLVTCEL